MSNPAKATLYVMNGCGHCSRIRAIVDACPAAQQQLVVADISTAPNGIEGAPAIVTSDGRRLVGGPAFDYVSSLGCDMQPPEPGVSTTVKVVLASLVLFILYKKRHWFTGFSASAEVHGADSLTSAAALASTFV